MRREAIHVFLKYMGFKRGKETDLGISVILMHYLSALSLTVCFCPGLTKERVMNNKDEYG